MIVWDGRVEALLFDLSCRRGHRHVEGIIVCRPVIAAARVVSSGRLQEETY